MNRYIASYILQVLRSSSTVSTANVIRRYENLLDAYGLQNMNTNFSTFLTGMLSYVTFHGMNIDYKCYIYFLFILLYFF